MNRGFPCILWDLENQVSDTAGMAGGNFRFGRGGKEMPAAALNSLPEFIWNSHSIHPLEIGPRR
jgi:hypothetical protein